MHLGHTIQSWSYRHVCKLGEVSPVKLQKFVTVMSCLKFRLILINSNTLKLMMTFHLTFGSLWLLIQAFPDRL